LTELGTLERILRAKREELAELGVRRLPPPPPRRALDLRRQRGAPLALIAEIKRRSPSAGVLSTALSVADRARAYERGGARMVSVLCDSQFFDGAFEHLALARNACQLPLLCKDFIIDERQLDAARAYGADAVLIIVRCVTESRLGELIRAARERQLVPFVEVVDERESALALASGADLIGVNARDLDTLQMDAVRAERVLEALPPEPVCVHLSGLSRPEHVRKLTTSRADAALVGEALMRLDDPGPLLVELVAAAKVDDPGATP
jgi:indole-3-glycerol phosphate synthase